MVWNQTLSSAEWANRISHLPANKDRIDQLLAEYQLMLLVGKQGSSKTNDLLHLMFANCYGLTWHGLALDPCPVLYIGFEGHPKKIDGRLKIIEPQYQRLGPKLHEWYVRMQTKKICLNTDPGRKGLADIIHECDPRPKLVLLDPFKKTVNGNYSNPDVAESWIQGASEIARAEQVAIVAACHTNKITYSRGEPPDALSEDKVKGAGDLLDGVNCAIMIAEEKGCQRSKDIATGASVVRWVTLGTVMKVLKAKDASGEFPLLSVSLDRKTLKLSGEEWSVQPNGDIVVV